MTKEITRRGGIMRRQSINRNTRSLPEGEYMLKKFSLAATALCLLALCCGFSSRPIQASKAPLTFQLTDSPILAKGIDKVDPPVNVERNGNDLIVTNTSEKAVTYVSFVIEFISKDKGVQPFGILLELGSGKWKEKADDSVYLAPSEKKTSPIVTPRIESFLDKLKQKRNFEPGDATVTLDIVMFNDDTMWRLGYLHKRHSRYYKMWIPEKPSKTQLTAIGKPPKAFVCDTNFGGGDRFVTCNAEVDCVIILPRAYAGVKNEYDHSTIEHCFYGWYGEYCSDYAMLHFHSCVV